MECKSKILFRGCLVFLLMPVMIWNYGKSVFRLAQVKEDTSVDSKLKLNRKSKDGSEQTTSGPEIDLKVTTPVQSKIPADSAVVTKSETNNRNTSSGDSENPGDERGSNESNIEPDLSGETYNVGAKKPAIPSRFDGANDSVRQQSESNPPVSFLGLLGIPTLVFSVLFFVMWGIISGKIQRIMF